MNNGEAVNSWTFVAGWTERKVRLLNCAVCRQALQALGPHVEAFIEVAEGIADGRVTEAEHNATLELAHLASRQYESDECRESLASQLYPISTSYTPERTWYGFTVVYGLLAILLETHQIDPPVMWDVLHNDLKPRPLPFSPSWRSATAVSIATQMYESRDFSAMPILADALQDTGCEDETILSHCRGPGPHFRGCWGVDLLLGKE